MTAPYYSDEHVRLYLGDCREVLPALDIAPDAAIVDPPYGYTSLEWDTWPDGWPAAVATVTSSMWCFGSLRMFLAHGPELALPGWRLSHDVVWRKHNGSGFQVDRFRCVHELAAHWYRGAWSDVRHAVPRERSYDTNKGQVNKKAKRAAHTGAIDAKSWIDDGTRIVQSVIDARSLWRDPEGIHPTQKPTAFLAPLLAYAVRPGGLILDPMAGSCSTAMAARLSGRRAVCIEAHEPYLEAAARRLDQGVLDVGGDAS